MVADKPVLHTPTEGLALGSDEVATCMSTGIVCGGLTGGFHGRGGGGGIPFHVIGRKYAEGTLLATYVQHSKCTCT